MAEKYFFVESTEELRYVWFYAPNIEKAREMYEEVRMGEKEVEELPQVSIRLKHCSMDYSGFMRLEGEDAKVGSKSD